MKKKIEILILVILCVVWVLVVATTYNKPYTTGLHLQIETNRNSYQVGEPVKIKFILTNVSKQVIALNNPFSDQQARYNFIIKLSGNKQQKVRPLASSLIPNLTPETELIMIEPRQQLIREFELYDYFPFLSPGVYLVKGYYLHRNTNTSSTSSDDKVWLEIIKSSRVKIAIKTLPRKILNNYYQNLTEGSEEEQKVAMIILALHQDERLLSVLGEILENRNKANNSLAVFALETLGYMGEIATPTLLKLLARNSQEQWPLIIYDLGLSGSQQANSTLISLLNNKSENIKCWSIKALSNSEDKESFKAIIDKGLKDPRETVRQISIESLARLRNKETVPLLEEILVRDFRPNIRKNAAKALYFINGKIYSYLDYQGKIIKFNPENDLSWEEKVWLLE